ncbi:DUF4386 domain-containing protein [Cohnella herbarum]|uniref:DUF4386 domain-containing protein n=2 Tax=Cohnella herbarum TaxID=2728023 RepID=A0A7Z2VRS8_9BACL|nr:DUF4386 domain-containing protein [Cohnella herbarum]
MNSYRKTAVAIGLLFLIATVAYMVGSGLIDSVIHSEQSLEQVYPERTKVMTGVFLELINAVAVVCIAILMFPILKKQNEAMAIGYYGSRIMESVFLLASIIGILLLVAASQDYAGSGATEGSYYDTIKTLTTKGYDLAFDLAMLVLSLGSLMFCYLLYRSQLVPRILSVIGLIGYVALLASSCLGIIGKDPGMLLFIPGAVFEIVFPIWLIVKGFNFKAKD